MGVGDGREYVREVAGCACLTAFLDVAVRHRPCSTPFGVLFGTCTSQSGGGARVSAAGILIFTRGSPENAVSSVQFTTEHVQTIHMQEQSGTHRLVVGLRGAGRWRWKRGGRGVRVEVTDV